MFASEEDDSFDAFVMSKKGGHHAFKQSLAEKESHSHFEEKNEPTPVVAASRAPPKSPKPPVHSTEPQVHLAPVGGRVALRATAPVGRRSLRESLGLRKSAPSNEPRKNDHTLATGSTELVLAGLEGMAAKQAPMMSDAQIRYVVGGETCVVVGGTAGIGFGIANRLASHGADVIVMGRRSLPDKNSPLKHIACDLSSFEQQIAAADKIADPQSLHLLIFTVGMWGEKQRQDNGDGVELQLAVSYLARRVMLDRLLERNLNPKCRVFIVNKCGADASKIEVSDFNGERDYDWKQQRLHAMVANDALILGMRKHYPNSLRIWGLNPGVVPSTDLRTSRFKNKAVGKAVEGIASTHALTVEEYVNVMIHIVSNPSLDPFAFAWSNRRRVISPSKYLSFSDNVDKVWALTDALIENSKK